MKKLIKIDETILMPNGTTTISLPLTQDGEVILSWKGRRNGTRLKNIKLYMNQLPVLEVKNMNLLNLLNKLDFGLQSQQIVELGFVCLTQWRSARLEISNHYKRELKLTTTLRMEE